MYERQKERKKNRIGILMCVETLRSVDETRLRIASSFIIITLYLHLFCLKLIEHFSCLSGFDLFELLRFIFRLFDRSHHYCLQFMCVYACECVCECVILILCVFLSLSLFLFVFPLWIRGVVFFALFLNKFLLR